jgi:hypothetical protein
MAEQLTEEQKVFIVRRLAVYTPMANILQDFSDQWPRQRLTGQDIAALDPLNGLADEKLLAIYRTRRADFFADLTTCAPASDRNVRLHILNRKLDIELERNGELGTIQSILRQMAEEMAATSDAIGGAGGTKPIEKVEWVIVHPKAEES